MKFEVIDAKGKIMFQTSNKKYMYSQSEINSMDKAGYRFKVNGKIVSKNKVIETVNKAE